MRKKQHIALVLAGGKGTRLGALTRELPKPAIPFGGTYRLIDFTLSNCKHSKVNVVGVIAQHGRHELARYLDSGSEWLSGHKDAEIKILHPKNMDEPEELYMGTADAIWKNLDFIEKHNPENILVLSSDHIYKMDYAKILKAHQQAGVSATIAAMHVPWKEAHRFGIIKTNEDDRIVSFQEKPLYPTSNLASMGIYVFHWPTLRDHLYISSMNPYSGMDIGKDIIPQLLVCGEKLAAYRFKGYWKDVGNIFNLWEANMELLAESPSVDLHGDWKIISREQKALLRHNNYRSGEGHFVNSLVAEGCINKGRVANSIISAGVEIGEGASVVESVIMPDVIIGKGAAIIKAIIAPNSVVMENTVVGGLQPIGRDVDWYRKYRMDRQMERPVTRRAIDRRMGHHVDTYQGISVVGSAV